MAAWLLVVSLLGLWAGADSHILQYLQHEDPLAFRDAVGIQSAAGEPEDAGEPWAAWPQELEDGGEPWGAWPQGDEDGAERRQLRGIDAYWAQKRKGAKKPSYRAPTFLDVKATIGPFTGVTWRGWGTSLAWFANFVGGLPPAQVDEICDALFDKRKGLGLNIVRYIIPGGFNPKHSANLTSRPFQAGGWGFRPWPGKTYNWSADANQRRVLVGAVRRGVDVTEAVAYSPPWWQTISKDTAGNKWGKQNIDEAMFPFFVTYITDIVANFKKLFGVEFSALDPFNEPLAGWWKQGGGQEGCGFKLASTVTIFNMTKQQLARKGMSRTAIIGLDDWATGTRNALEKYPQELGSLLTRIAVHGYRVPTIVYRPSKKDFEDWVALRKQVHAMGKELWMVEWGPWSTIPKDPSDLEIAFIQSRTMAEQINIFGTAAFVHWQAVAPSSKYLPEWPIPSGLGMIRVEYDYAAKFKPQYTKQFYAQLHYSKWIVPGSRIINVVGVTRFLCVAYNPAAQELIMVITNQRPSFGRLTFAAPTLTVKSLNPLGLRASAYRTSATENYRLVFKGVLGQSLETLSPIKVVPNSITTVVFHNVLVS